ncbi:MAG TPA: TatD family deoxyribonuclease [Candidatus Vogelbacteria bacterium]|nr:TatD family deoxyribonuclease [Candidatus Vogelbacteria bacterium]
MIPEFIDIHAHVNFAVFNNEAEEIIKKTLDENVWLINVGSQKATSWRAVFLAEKYPQGVYASIGHHPIHSCSSSTDDEDEDEVNKSQEENPNDFDIDYYRHLAKSKKVVSIGECGLDYFHLKNDEDKKEQRKIFIEQLELAQENKLPIMLHIREAFDDALAILKDFKGLKVNVHFFSGDWLIARTFLDLGHTLSFTGVITFTSQYDEIIKNCPLDRIMSETDCPYVSPEPYRNKRNEPLNVRLVAERIAYLRPEPKKEVLKALVDNAIRTFNFV